LADSLIVASKTVATHTNDDPLQPTVANLSQALVLSPTTQLDPINRTYRLKVTIGHYRTAASFLPVAGNDVTLAPQRLLHLNGRLLFGAIETRYTSLGNNPIQGVISGGTMPTSLGVDGQSGFVVGMPSHTYGDGTLLSVRVSPDGTARLAAGSVVLTGPSPDEEMIQNVRMVRGPVTLDVTGAKANLAVYHPAGFSYAFNPDGKLTLGASLFTAISLGQDLIPLADPQLSPFGSDVWVVEETKPVWMKVTGIKWLMNQGKFEWDASGEAQYVRKKEYERLATSTATTGKAKASNERYYESIDKVLGSKIVVEANDKGAAMLTVQFGFKPGAFAPHFPLGSAAAWTVGGEQSVERLNPRLEGRFADACRRPARPPPEYSGCLLASRRSWRRTRSWALPQVEELQGRRRRDVCPDR
jgi:hypothetical protein